MSTPTLSAAREVVTPHDQVPAEGPAQHCRNALQLLDELQRRLLDDPTYGALPLHESLRLLAGARGRIWRAVWACERQSPRRSP